MKLWTSRTSRTAPTPIRPDVDDRTGCTAGLAHCHETLLLHADGSAECEGFPTCGLDPAGHDLWTACSDLDRCGCTGADHDQVHDLPVAA